jgi:hypothetical protein
VVNDDNETHANKKRKQSDIPMHVNFEHFEDEVKVQCGARRLREEVNINSKVLCNLFLPLDAPIGDIADAPDEVWLIALMRTDT